MRAKPEVWEVNGVMYTVEEVEKCGGNHGDCDYELGRIRLLSKLAPSPKSAVLRHELAHAAMWECGARAALRRLLPDKVADDLEEDLLDRFIPVYCGVRRVK